MNYDDIIHLPHHTSRHHSAMPRSNRAAQFAPFAALSGYGDAIEETARLTQHQLEPDEEGLQLMNEQLRALLEVIRDQPEVRITYFEPDDRKAGGSYQCVTGRIRRVDEVSRQIILADRTVIAMDAVSQLDCVMR